MKDLKKTERIDILKDKMLAEPRYASIEQARIITRVYKVLDPRESISASVQQTSFIEAQWFREKTVCYGGNSAFS